LYETFKPVIPVAGVIRRHKMTTPRPVEADDSDGLEELRAIGRRMLKVTKHPLLREKLEAILAGVSVNH
jgi:hypothetical protein